MEKLILIVVVILGQNLSICLKTRTNITIVSYTKVIKYLKRTV
jgi:hypothetical protein